MVLLLDLNFSPPEEEDNIIPEGGNVDHPEEEEGINEHAHEDAGTILSLQVNGWHYNVTRNLSKRKHEAYTQAFYSSNLLLQHCLARPFWTR